MDATIAGFVGTIIGAVAGVIGTIVAHRLEMQSERANWLKEKKEEAYSNSIRYLLKVMNKRTNIRTDGTTYINQDALKEWFDDMSETQNWLVRLTIYCGQKYKEEISQILDNFNKDLRKAIEINKKSDEIIVTFHIPSSLSTYDNLVRCAHNDLSEDIK